MSHSSFHPSASPSQHESSQDNNVLASATSDEFDTQDLIAETHVPPRRRQAPAPPAAPVQVSPGTRQFQERRSSWEKRASGSSYRPTARSSPTHTSEISPPPPPRPSLYGPHHYKLQQAQWQWGAASREKDESVGKSLREQMSSAYAQLIDITLIYIASRSEEA